MESESQGQFNCILKGFGQAGHWYVFFERREVAFEQFNKIDVSPYMT